MERYEILRKYRPLYSNNAPVFVLAGQLVKDNVTDDCLLQLKFQNVGDKAIKAVSIYAKTYDAFGNLLDVGEYSYLDVNSGRESVFGDDKVITLKNNQTRDIEFEIREIVFYNDSVLDVTDAKWETLPEKIALSYKISDPKMMEQYRLENGKNTLYIAREFGDYWYCTCGAVNHSHELNCHSCRKNLAEIKETYDLDALAVRLQERLDKEEREERKKAEQTKRIIKWTVSVAAAAVCLFLLVTQLILPYKTYRQALSNITAGNYQQAYTELKSVKDFSDSRDYLNNFYILPTHIEDNQNALSMDMKYDKHGRLIEEDSTFMNDEGREMKYKTVYTYEGNNLVSSLTESGDTIFEAVYSDSGKTVECKLYNKNDVHDGIVDENKAKNYTYTLSFDEHQNLTSVELTGDYEQSDHYSYTYDENDQLSEIKSEYYTYYSSYEDGIMNKISDGDSYELSYDNQLFYSPTIEPSVGWWYRNPWFLFVENRV